MTLERLLNSVGKSTFVKYYYNFKNQTSEYCLNHFEEDYTDKAKATRVSHAKTIFKNGWEFEALRLIISSNRVDIEIRQKAKQILLENSK